MHFHFQNVNDAFLGLVKGIDGGHIPVVETSSRNGPVMQVLEPVIVTYTHPTQRVLFNQKRDANPFFHLFESLWMLAGRNDVAPLTYYNKNIENYSDDGTTFNGAYGYRWRQTLVGEGFDIIDQIQVIIDHLRKTPDSRRAVLQMWNVEDDLLKIDRSKDVCCLAGETKFRSPEGDTRIDELAKRFQTQESYKFPVYSVDTVTGDQRLCWMTNAWKTGIRKVLKISFDDGSNLRITGDHKVFKKAKLFNGKRCIGISVTEVAAADLMVGDSILATLSKNAGCRTTTAGYIQFKKNVFDNTNYKNMELEHRAYLSMFGQLKKYREDGFSVHHINGNKADNRIENIVQIDNYTHFSHDKFGSNNPHCKMSSQAKLARGRKHSKAIKAHWDSMDQDTRRAYACRRLNRTERDWELITEHQSTRSNHKVVSIEVAGYTTVYDFEVPGRHNAVLDNGVVVHNCNTNVYFARRDNFLDMTVCNRSNDMIWGMLGANVVHFSFLQEYIANCLGVEVGLYHQITNNLHVYKNNWKPEVWLSDAHYDYSSINPEGIPLVAERERFDKECNAFVEQNGDGTFEEPFLMNVAQPMIQAFQAHKCRDYERAYHSLEHVAVEDWRMVGMLWIRRREEAWRKNKTAVE